MRALLASLLPSLRARRWCHLFVVNLRILLGFAFLPSGLKKILAQPFTDPQNTGTFHEFLHAFHATGFFYQFVGSVQVLIALLLMTQTFASLGALMALPVITTIMVFCWSTNVVPTAIVTTLMWSGTVGLVVWDAERLIPAFAPRGFGASSLGPADLDLADLDLADLDLADLDLAESGRREAALIDLALWRACGGGIFFFYGLTCLVYGGVYRPKGFDLQNPAFYVLWAILLFPLAAFFLEQRRRAARLALEGLEPPLQGESLRANTSPSPPPGVVRR
ncbi:MAG: hypothetical protein AAF725_09995 [Acidobacteriota bacterium]